MIPRGNVAGKLDGAWRVVPRSQGTLIRSHTDSFFTSRAQVQKAIWRQINLGLKTKIDWVLQDMRKRMSLRRDSSAVEYCAELILWTSRTGD